jgi:hypothetical protein
MMDECDCIHNLADLLLLQLLKRLLEEEEEVC